jgi:hypothetical protein
VSAPAYLLTKEAQRNDMTTFDDREKAFENLYARDQETQFRIIARRNRLLGEWAAKLMGLTEVESESYAKDVVRADFEEAGDDDVVRKVLGDLTSAGVECDETRIREALDHKFAEARRQFIQGMG